MGKMIELKASDGHKLAAYRADPPGKPRGGIVVIPEIFGVNSHIKSVADGFAKDGYVAIAPAMFDRVQRNFDVGYTPPDIEKGRELRAKITVDMAMKDAQAAIDAVKNVGKLGIVGYCWGGFVAWMASARLSGLSAAVPYYGGGILDNADIEPKVPVMAHFGEKDSIVDWRSTMALYRETLGRSDGAPLSIKTFPACNHNLQQCQTGGFRETRTGPPRPACDGYLDTITEWIRAKGLARGTAKVD